MIGALLSFSVMAVSIRELSRAGLSIFEILAIRSGVALLVLLVLLALRPDLRLHAVPRRMGLHIFPQHHTLRIAIFMGTEPHNATTCDCVCAGIHDAGVDGSARGLVLARAHDCKPLSVSLCLV